LTSQDIPLLGEFLDNHLEGLRNLEKNLDMFFGIYKNDYVN
jgi:hypothetical protein